MKIKNKFRKYFAYAMIPGCLLMSGTCVRAEEGWGTADWSGIKEDWLETEMPDSLQVTFVNFDEYWKEAAEEKRTGNPVPEKRCILDGFQRRRVCSA